MSVQEALEDKFVVTRDIKKGEVLKDGDFEYIPPGIGFERALSILKDGGRVRRRGWNSKGMWITYQKAYPDGIPINKNTAEATGLPEGSLQSLLPYIMMRTAGGQFVPWLASQTDLLSDDWEVVS